MRMIDAENIDRVSLTGFDIVVVYGSNFGSTQGPGRETPAAFIRSLQIPTWIIYFPGANAQFALDEARSYPYVKGIFLDVEAQYEQDARTNQLAQQFGSFLKNHVPTGIYSHRSFCTRPEIRPHFDGIWCAGEPSSPPKAYEAIQWGYFGSYDESIADPWFARPRDTNMVIEVRRVTTSVQAVPLTLIDSFTLFGTTIIHTVSDDTGVNHVDTLPGIWYSLIDARITPDGKTISVFGLASDGFVYQTQFTFGTAAWTPPVRITS